MGEDAIEDAVLVVAELLVNVVVHARTPFRLASICVSRRYGCRIGGACRKPHSANPTVGNLSSLRRRRCRVLLGPAGDETGKTVWAEFAVRPSPR